MKATFFQESAKNFGNFFEFAKISKNYPDFEKIG